jgi:hypothetical protein
MSLPQFSAQAELFSTAAVAGTLFPANDRFRRFAQKIYPVLAQARPQLEKCYCATNGRVAVEPVWLLGVSLLQYLEAVPDRQAVELLRYHAGWSFALNRQIGDPKFHPTTLVNFRQRLLEHGQETLGFQMVLNALVEAGLVARKARQRLDSTQMFGRVSRMSRLECVRETMRLALNELGAQVPENERPQWWSMLWDRYVDTQTDYRASLEVLARKMTQAGQDAHQLLAWAKEDPESGWTQGREVQLLQRVFSEQFEFTSPASPEPKTKEQLCSERVQNPHDPDATYASKGNGEHRKEHVGYKIQVAETVSEAMLAPGEPTRNFITGIVAHAARESDEEGALKMAAEQQAMGLEKPPVTYVDAAYISTEKLVAAASENRELIGPAPKCSSNNEGRFQSDAFQVQVEQRQATCPAGHQNSQCSRLVEKATSRVAYRFEWSNSTCRACSMRRQCINDKHQHRTLVVGENHTVLQARRNEQKTDAFKTRMKHRNAIEGTQSELVRAHGLRRARYRSLAKTRLQSYFSGAACNLKRWLRRMSWESQQALASAINPTPMKS